MQREVARQKFCELRRRKGHIPPKELDEVWAALETVRIDEIIGSWAGSSFDTGHESLQALEGLRWHGKQFNSPLDAKPLICYDTEGKLYSNTEISQGEASLWMVEFRGEVTATMVYDARPVFDHFKKVDDNTLIGIMNGKEDVILDKHGQHFYFILDRT